MIARSTVAAFLAAAFFLTGCGEKSTEPDAPVGSLYLHLSHVVSSPTLRAAAVEPEPLVFNDIRYATPFGNEFSVQTLKYFISNIELQGPDGDVTLADLHYVDAEDPSTLEAEFDGIPERHYHKLVFTFGLDEAMNVSGALADTPQNLNMLWPDVWGGGYHYMKLEGQVIPAGGFPPTLGFLTHLGRYAGSPDFVPHPHFFTVEFDLHQTILRDDELHAEVIMDVNGWYRQPNEIDLETQAAGIMDNTPVQDMMQANGAYVFYLGEVSGGHGEEEPH